MSSERDSAPASAWHSLLLEGAADAARTGHPASELMRALVRMIERAAVLARAEPGELPRIVVLVSRRMSCLYDMLVLRGMNPFEGCEVVSDRVLDGSPPDWRGRRAVLCDDSLILGSTLGRRFVELARAVGEPLEPTDAPKEPLITTLVAAVDKARCNPYIVQRLGILDESEGGPLRRPTKALQEFSRRVTASLCRNGMPYFSDFPMTEEFAVSEEQLKMLLATPEWESFEARAEEVCPPGHTSFTLFPGDTVLHRYRLGAVQGMADLVQLSKIRLFVRPHDTELDKLLVRVVPIAVPVPLMGEDLHKILTYLAQELKPSDKALLNWTGWNPPARHRLLQMYLSTCLLAEYWSELHRAGVSRDELSIARIHDAPLRHYFGATDFESVARAFGYAVRFYNDPPKSGREPLRIVSTVEPTPTLWSEPKVKAALWEVLEGATMEVIDQGAGEPSFRYASQIWAKPILNLFSVITDGLEVPQEGKLQVLTWPEFVDYLDKPGEIGRRVLDQGITISEIANTLAELDGIGLDYRMLSLAIDIANDIGVAVPTTTWNGANGPVYRQYRPGENAFLACASPLALGRRPLATAWREADLLTLGEFNLDPLGLDEDVFDRMTDDQARRFGRYHASLEAKALRVPGALQQVWIGRVLDFDGLVLEVQVAARLSQARGSQQVVKLPIDAVIPSDRRRVASGSLIKWRVMSMDGGAQCRDVSVVGQATDLEDELKS